MFSLGNSGFQQLFKKNGCAAAYFKTIHSRPSILWVLSIIMKVKIAIFASGAGSNAQKIIDHFRHHTHIEVALIVCNNPQAGVLDIALNEDIPFVLIEKNRFTKGNAYLPELHAAGVKYLILAGFLWKIPSAIIAHFPQKIINIHPALLPKYGGKGMYGHFVHEAVLAACDADSGITIHYVDEHYDHGATIFQTTCKVEATDTPETLAQKIHVLEHGHYARVIENVIAGTELFKNPV